MPYTQGYSAGVGANSNLLGLMPNLCPQPLYSTCRSKVTPYKGRAIHCTGVTEHMPHDKDWMTRCPPPGEGRSITALPWGAGPSLADCSQ